MAFDFSKLNFFNRLDARSRVFVLLGAVVGFFVIVYVGTRYFWGDTRVVGPSQVATAPAGVQSRPGSTLSPEFQRAIQQSDALNREQAQLSGGSAVPTFMNLGDQTTPGSCVICADESANVKDDLNPWVRQGKLSPDTANYLQELADRNTPLSEYAAELDRLVREGKLTPDQARQLLEKYKKQHGNRLLAESETLMDGLIKSGELPIDVANQLLEAQKKGMSPSDYALELQRLVREGKISPEVAQRLLAQYTQQRAKEVVAQSIASLKKMTKQGQITPAVEKELEDLETRLVPLDVYSSTLNRLLSENKITPDVAKKILDEFKQQKAAIGPTGALNQALQNAEAAAYNELRDLLKAGKISQDTATQIGTLIQKNISFDGFVSFINQLTQQGKLTPDIAKLKIADYKLVRGIRDEMGRLSNLQANNVSASAYANELKRAIEAGIITPEQAKQLLQEYQALLNQAPVGGPVAGDSDFARLQQRALAGAQAQDTVSGSEFDTTQAAAQQESDEDRMNRLQNLMNAMNGQAQQLIGAWQPPAMEHRGGSYMVEKEKEKVVGDKTDSNGRSTSRSDKSSKSSEEPSLIKAGAILFAVLDTAVNSDYPDSPVLATVVEGKFKGAKLLGKMVLTQGVAGQMDRVALNFTLMDMEDWPKSKTVTAYAIDPDTGRSVIASDVSYHYLKRYGAIMATAFLQGYSTSITNAGTATTGIFGTSTTHPNLSAQSKIAVGLGQVGQNLGSVVQNYANIPPTVRVDSGVGLGILFMAEVTE